MSQGDTSMASAPHLVHAGAPVCWWCEESLGTDAVRMLPTQNRHVIVHARCISQMLVEGKVGAYLAAGTLLLDADEI